MQVTDTGTIFEVESNDAETVRVIKGSVNATVLGSATDPNATLDTVQVGVGQEMALNPAILQSYQNHETPSVLMALDDQFKQTDWYSWNSGEDAAPTDFSSQQSLPVVPLGLNTQQNVPATPGETQEASELGLTQQPIENAPTDVVLTTPVITQPDPPVMTTDQNKVSISGTVGAGTAKVVVHETVGGVSDDYTLSKFKSGNTTFSYNVSVALGNYKPGENDYSFSAFDASGNQSGSAVVTITYNNGQASVQSQTQQVTGALTAPQVLTYNGVASNVVTTGVVKIIGSVAGAQTVVVNGYALSKFQPGDTSWTYFANENGGNLNPGLNSYQVYATDPAGNKSDVTTFTITYNKPAGSTQQAAASSVAAGSASTQASTSTGTTTTQVAAPAAETQQNVPDGF
jgi:hypothetical protein